MTQESLLVVLGGAVMASLVSATVYLFHRFEKAKQELIEKFESDLAIVNQRLQDCEDDRNALRKQIVELAHQLAELKRKVS